MGKFGSLFKKSDDKQKPASPAPSSNPYASPSTDSYASSSTNPYAQPSPPTQHQQYQQYNSAQHRDNERASQSSYGAASQSSYSAPSYGSSSGLPSGPRPGGLPARVNQGAGTWSSGHDSYGPPPSYSAGADDSSATHSNRTSPSVVSSGFSRATGSAQTTPTIPSQGRSPALSSGAPSPAFGSKTATGYPSEKYGATDTIGRNRFDAPAPSRYGQYAPPSQRPGGYGNLDTAREELFSGYNRSQNAGPNLAQSQSPQFEPGNFPDREHMTEQELEDAEASDWKAAVRGEQMAYEDTLDRTLARAEEAEAGLDAAHETVNRQEEGLDSADMHMAHTHNLNDEASDSAARLKHVNRPLFMPGFSSAKQDQIAAARAERNVKYLQDMDEMRSAHQSRRQQVQRMPEDKDSRVIAPKSVSQATLAKYTFEDDGDQAERLARMEIKEERLGAITGRLQTKAIAFGERIDESNKRLDKMTESATRARDNIARNEVKMMRAAGIKDY